MFHPANDDPPCLLGSQTEMAEVLARGVQTVQAIEARYDLAARKLNTLAVRSRALQIRRGGREWSAIFDEIVPDAGQELGLETA